MDPYRSGVRFDPAGSPLDYVAAMSWAERAGIVLGAVGLLAGFVLIIAVVVIAGAAMGVES